MEVVKLRYRYKNVGSCPGVLRNMYVPLLPQWV